jgi:hypothetical protein
MLLRLHAPGLLEEHGICGPRGCERGGSTARPPKSQRCAVTLHRQFKCRAPSTEWIWSERWIDVVADRRTCSARAVCKAPFADISEDPH